MRTLIHSAVIKALAHSTWIQTPPINLTFEYWDTEIKFQREFFEDIKCQTITIP